MGFSFLLFTLLTFITTPKRGHVSRFKCLCACVCSVIKMNIICVGTELRKKMGDYLGGVGEKGGGEED